MFQSVPNVLGIHGVQYLRKVIPPATCCTLRLVPLAGAGLILIVDSVRDAGVTIDGLKRGFVPLKLFLEASREGLMLQTTSGGMTNLVVIGKVPPTRDSMHIQTYINITIHTYVYIYICVSFSPGHLCICS